MNQSRSVESHFEVLLRSGTEGAGLLDPRADGQQLQVNVLYTTPEGTLGALEEASRLARNLGTRPRVLRFYAVPFSLPLEKPPVSIGYLEEQIHALGDRSPIEIDARVILCRDPRASLREFLPQHSLVVVGGKKRWWATKEERLTESLRKDGHEVIFVEQE